MKEKMKFGVISKKENLELVEAQACKPGKDCLSDCSREIWSGNSNKYTNGCSIREHKDAHWSRCR
ncbi:hypothetical protein [Peptoniphilus lacydonensis]|uniref:hypothetical protein n=1 Tax=Peptoniphilus lacydonensis TaxID=1673725 RepID=UPI0008DA859E|nr:hypothetical protein [Peptoniphilus lacydonensis]